MGCCKSNNGTSNSETSSGNADGLSVDKAPDGTILGDDGSQGGKIPYYATPGGSMTGGNSGGPYTASDSMHATGANYSAKKMGTVSTELGGLSSQYESNGDPGAIGKDGTGGYSYGSYQIATKTGTMNNFLEYEKVNNPDAYAKLEAAGGADGASSGSSEFQSTWKDLASNDSSFASDQKGFIESTHYDVAASNILNNSGLDISKRSLAVQDAVWSTAVQNGPNSAVFTNAFAGKDTSNMSDADIINSLYDERSKTTSSGSLVYFSKSSTSVQNSVKNRFTNERTQALSMLSGN